MKRWMHICSVFVMVMLCVFLLPSEAKAAGLEDLTYVVEDGGVTISDCNEAATGELVIPAAIEGKPVVGIGDFAFYRCSKLTGITIPDSVTGIGESAFAACGGLTNVVIPDSVRNIGKEAFFGCRGLTSLTLPFIGDSRRTAEDTDAKPFGYLFGSQAIDGFTKVMKSPGNTRQFYYFPASLTSVTITGGEVVQAAFYDCETLTNITLPNGATVIGDYAFSGCGGLTAIVIPDGVTRIGSSAFSYTGITEITIPKGVKSIGSSAFGNCQKLVSIKLPNGLTEIGELIFDKCTGIKSITLPDSVTTIGAGAFRSCSNLTQVNIPYGVTALYKGTFEDCTSMLSVVVPDSVTSIGMGTFTGCSALESITLPFVGGSVKRPEDTHQYPFGYIFGQEDRTGCSVTPQYFYDQSLSSTSRQYYRIPKSLKSVTITGGYILNGAFYECRSLGSITLGDGITGIEENAFYNCENVTRIRVPNSVKKIGKQAFYGCSSLEEIDLPNGLTEIAKYTFHGCSSLKSAVIPNGVTSIGRSAFYECEKMESISIPDSVTEIGQAAFSGCAGLKSIVIPDGVTSLPKGLLIGCKSLESVTLPFVGEKRVSATDRYQYPFGHIFTDIPAYASASYKAEQWYCVDGNATKKATYYIPESLRSVTITGGYIPHGAFYNCSGLTNITLEEGVTNIGGAAFYNCKMLQEVTIPSTVSAIGDQAFFGCSLGVVRIRGSVKSIGNSAFACESIHHVLFDKSEQEWNRITIGSGNDALLAAARHYNSTGNEIINGVCTVCETAEHTHVWDGGKVTKEATCKEAGVKTYTCTDCKETKTETIEKLITHTWDSGKVTKEVTCKEAGVKTYTCTVCAETKTEEIAKLTTHTPGAEATATTPQICTVCGKELKPATGAVTPPTTVPSTTVPSTTVPPTTVPPTTVPSTTVPPTTVPPTTAPPTTVSPTTATTSNATEPTVTPTLPQGNEKPDEGGFPVVVVVVIVVLAGGGAAAGVVLWKKKH